jgi:outer membrane protein assembly factor BamD
VQHYPQTDRVEEALQIMITSYEKLGLTDMADDTRKVLQLNFPGAPAEYVSHGHGCTSVVCV